MSNDFTGEQQFYTKCVREAKRHLEAYNKVNIEANRIRNKIADIAISIRRTHKLTVFASDVGIKYTTLFNWVNERESNVKTLVEKQGTFIDRGALNRTLKRIDRDTPAEKVEQIYNRERSKSREDVQLAGYASDAKSMRFRLCSEWDLQKVDEDDLMEVYVNVGLIVIKLMDHYAHTYEDMMVVIAGS